MKRVAWLTDVHLNFLDDEARREFLKSVARQSPHAVFVSGDIGESPDVAQSLREMAQIVRRPIYFVLGNHDFYRGSIAGTRLEMTRVASESELLFYLSECGAVELTPATAVVGHDGWGDARLGDYEHSRVMLNDFFLIEELRRWNPAPWEVDPPRLKRELRALGDESAGHFARLLPEAFEAHRRVVAVTHVPPFRETAWHRGRYSDEEWLPFFACKAVGDVMLEAMRERPDQELLVLCGHTHGSGRAEILDNLTVLTGGAEYGEPAIQEVFEFE